MAPHVLTHMARSIVHVYQDSLVNSAKQVELSMHDIYIYLVSPMYGT